MTIRFGLEKGGKKFIIINILLLLVFLLPVIDKKKNKQNLYSNSQKAAHKSKSQTRNNYLLNIH